MILGSIPELMPESGGPALIYLSRDRMEAYLVYNSGRVTRDEIDSLLKENGIVYGIRDQVIEKAVSIPLAGDPLLIAKGSEPVHGEDARIEFITDAGRERGKPSETLTGRVDYYNLNLIHNVEEGEVIAVKISATEGAPGYTVTGEEIPPKPGKDVQLAAGRNVKIVAGGEVGLPEGNIAAVATCNGHVSVAGNKLNVSSLYEVEDVDFSTGNIEFKGSVLIKGSVREGFRVTAEGDVMVMNGVSDGIVECGGNLKVINGIVGSRCRIKAAGSVEARFIENSAVEAGENITVGEAVLHSRLNAGKSVQVNGKGVITGGCVIAGDEIRCAAAGSQLSAVTELEAGVDPDLRSDYYRLLKDVKTADANYDKADYAIKVLGHIQQTTGRLPSDKQALLLKLTKIQASLAREIKDLRAAIRTMQERIMQSDRGRISVRGTVHPGVRIVIGAVSTQVRDAVSFVCFTKSGEEIRVSPYK